MAAMGLRQALLSDDPALRAGGVLAVLKDVSEGTDSAARGHAVFQVAMEKPADIGVDRLSFEVACATDMRGLQPARLLAQIENVIRTAATVRMQRNMLMLLAGLAQYDVMAAAASDGDAVFGVLSLVAHCFTAASASVRSAAYNCMAAALASPALLHAAANNRDQLALVRSWLLMTADGMLDDSPAAAGAAARSLMTAVCTNPTTPTVDDSAVESTAAWLRREMVSMVAQHIMCDAGAVIARMPHLTAAQQVPVMHVMLFCLTWSLRRADRDVSDVLLHAGSFAPSSRDAASKSESETNPPQVEVDHGWIINALGNQLVMTLDSCSAAPAVTLDVATGLLSAAELLSQHSMVRYGNGTASWTSQPAPPKWATEAVQVLVTVWKANGGAQWLRRRITARLCMHLACLQPDIRLALSKSLISMVANVPDAVCRTAALTRLWRALVDMCLEGGAAQRGGLRVSDPAPVPGFYLVDVLEDPRVKGVLSGQLSATDRTFQEAASRGILKVFQQELASSLLAVLLDHPHARLVAVVAQHGVQMTPEASAAASIEAAAETAAAALRATMVSQWIAAAVVALQGTQACLGWGRGERDFTYPCTLVVDKWLQLLHFTSHAAQQLLTQHAMLALMGYGVPNGTGIGTGGSDDVPVGISARFDGAHKIAQAAMTNIQVLLDRVMQFWNVLSPAVKPRALFVAVRCLRDIPCRPFIPDSAPAGKGDAQGKKGGTTRSLMEGIVMAVRDVVTSGLFPLSPLERRPQPLEEATACGAMPYSSAASQQPNANDSTRKKRYGDATSWLYLPPTADTPDADLESLESAVSTLELIASAMLDHVAQHSAAAQGLPAVDGYMRDACVAMQQTAAWTGSTAQQAGLPAIEERCLGVSRALIHIQNLLPPPPQPPQNDTGGTAESTAGWNQNIAGGAGDAAVLRLEHDVLCCGEPCGLPFGAPTLAPLLHCPRTQRHKQLSAQLSTVNSGTDTFVLPHLQDYPVQHGVHDAPQQHGSGTSMADRLLPQFTSMGDEWQEVSMGDSPLQLSARVTLQHSSRKLHAALRATNSTDAAIADAIINIMLGSAVHAATPLETVWKLPPLTPGQSVSHEVTLTVTSFRDAWLLPIIELNGKLSGTAAVKVKQQCRKCPVPLLALLGPSSSSLWSAPEFFRQWSSWPYQCCVSLRIPVPDFMVREGGSGKGDEGGVLAASLESVFPILTAPPFHQVWSQQLPAGGGFHAASVADVGFAAKPLGVVTIVKTIAATTMADNGDTAQHADADSSPRLEMACQVVFRCGSESVIAAIMEESSRWQELLMTNVTSSMEGVAHGSTADDTAQHAADAAVLRSARDHNEALEGFALARWQRLRHCIA